MMMETCPKGISLKRRNEWNHHAMPRTLAGLDPNGAGASISPFVSTVSSPPESRRLGATMSFPRSRHESVKSSESAMENIEELEMLLEAYFVVIDSTLNKLTSV